jgi:hypothetical protein
LTKGTVVIDPGVAQVRERQALQCPHGIVGTARAGADVVEQNSKGDGVHDRPILPAP